MVWIFIVFPKMPPQQLPEEVADFIEKLFTLKKEDRIENFNQSQKSELRKEVETKYAKDAFYDGLVKDYKPEVIVIDGNAQYLAPITHRKSVKFRQKLNIHDSNSAGNIDGAENADNLTLHDVIQRFIGMVSNSFKQYGENGVQVVGVSFDISAFSCWAKGVTQNERYKSKMSQTETEKIELANLAMQPEEYWGEQYIHPEFTMKSREDRDKKVGELRKEKDKLDKLIRGPPSAIPAGRSKMDLIKESQGLYAKISNFEARKPLEEMLNLGERLPGPWINSSGCGGQSELIRAIMMHVLTNPRYDLRLKPNQCLIVTGHQLTDEEIETLGIFCETNDKRSVVVKEETDHSKNETSGHLRTKRKNTDKALIFFNTQYLKQLPPTACARGASAYNQWCFVQRFLSSNENFDRLLDHFIDKHYNNSTEVQSGGNYDKETINCDTRYLYNLPYEKPTVRTCCFQSKHFEHTNGESDHCMFFVIKNLNNLKCGFSYNVFQVDSNDTDASIYNGAFFLLNQYLMNGITAPLIYNSFGRYELKGCNINLMIDLLNKYFYPDFGKNRLSSRAEGAGSVLTNTRKNFSDTNRGLLSLLLAPDANKVSLGVSEQVFPDNNWPVLNQAGTMTSIDMSRKYRNFTETDSSGPMDDTEDEDEDDNDVDDVDILTEEEYASKSKEKTKKKSEAKPLRVSLNHDYCQPYQMNKDDRTTIPPAITVVSLFVLCQTDYTRGWKNIGSKSWSMALDNFFNDLHPLIVPFFIDPGFSLSVSTDSDPGQASSSSSSSNSHRVDKKQRLWIYDGRKVTRAIAYAYGCRNLACYNDVAGVKKTKPKKGEEAVDNRILLFGKLVEPQIHWMHKASTSDIFGVLCQKRLEGYDQILSEWFEKYKGKDKVGVKKASKADGKEKEDEYVLDCLLIMKTPKKGKAAKPKAPKAAKSFANLEDRKKMLTDMQNLPSSIDELTSRILNSVYTLIILSQVGEDSIMLASEALFGFEALTDDIKEISRTNIIHSVLVPRSEPIAVAVDDG